MGSQSIRLHAATHLPDGSDPLTASQFTSANYFDAGTGPGTVTSGAVLDIADVCGHSIAGSDGSFDSDPGPPRRLRAIKPGYYIANASWPWLNSFNGDRFLRIGIQPAIAGLNGIVSPFTTRSQITPDGDFLSVTAIWLLDDISACPAPFTFEVYQASGGNQPSDDYGTFVPQFRAIIVHLPF